jgi:hypothetical protein
VAPYSYATGLTQAESKSTRQLLQSKFSRMASTACDTFKKTELCSVVGEATSKNCSLKWSSSSVGMVHCTPCTYEVTPVRVMCVSTANLQLHTKYKEKEIIPTGWLACLVRCGGLLAVMLVGAKHCSTTQIENTKHFD